ncbi:sugar ABC transporter substrate-binding protein [Ruminococcus sp. OA3]|uniref:sugar ABC transporter substrate-binding protein n=1 Tax=Ruminococcus sp. OA3 TaxID=2914164 RepID=UPI001F051AC3|nr:sugar ABC transporter substrate-binding protein [Ruminococcus sp. OA3]MCH1983499.1 sugar ABC transporter substrate-binding protein [Ruminococcus sp. OA3]
MRKAISVLIAGTILVTTLLGGCASKSSGQQDWAAETVRNKDTAQAPAEDAYIYRVGVSNLADSDESCYTACKTMADIIESEEFADAVGNKVEVEWVDSDNNIDKQTSNVELLLAKGIDAMFIIGVDTAGNAASVKACNAAGVPVFMVATESSAGEYKFVGFNEYDCGYAQGKYIAEHAGEGENICYIEGTAGREATILRGQGFEEALAGRSDLTILSRQSGDWTTEGAMQITEDWIQAYGDDIDWIATQDNKMAQGAIEVLKAADMTDKIKVNGWIVSGTWDVELMTGGYEEYAVYVSFKVLGEKMAEVCRQFFTEGYEACEEKSYMDIYDVTMDNVSEIFDLN